MISNFAKFKMNIRLILKLFYTLSTSIFGLVGILLSFITFEELGVTNVYHKLLIFLIIVILAFIISTLLVVFVLKKNRIWSKGKNKVYASYGDLLRYAFKVKEKNRKIIVIPVNDAFDTIVDVGGESVINPLVSPKSIHGEWIRRICEQLKISPEELNDKIQKNLDLQKRKPEKIIKIEEKPRGNLKSYPIGTVAVIDGSNSTTFYLLAISTFNENNNARSSKRKITEAVDDLIEFYDSNGQGYPLFMPLMGTGSSRANISHTQSLRIIKSCILTAEEKINGSMNIIVFNGDRDKVSIFN